MIAEKKRMRLRMKAMRARRSSAVMVANVSAGGSAEGDIESASEASPSDTQRHLPRRQRRPHKGAEEEEGSPCICADGSAHEAQ